MLTDVSVVVVAGVGWSIAPLPRERGSYKRISHTLNCSSNNLWLNLVKRAAQHRACSSSTGRPGLSPQPDTKPKTREVRYGARSQKLRYWCVVVCFLFNFIDIFIRVCLSKRSEGHFYLYILFCFFILFVVLAVFIYHVLLFLFLRFISLFVKSLLAEK